MNRVGQSAMITEPAQSVLNPGYDELLRDAGIQYVNAEYYWQVGEIRDFRGWVIHLSVIKPQIRNLFKMLLPHFMNEKVPFKIVKDDSTADLMLNGNLGYVHLAKIICLYPDSTEIAVNLAKQLVMLTREFKGPVIPTDYHLGTIVFTHHDPFVPVGLSNADEEIANQMPFRLSHKLDWPFGELAHYSQPVANKLLNKTYYQVSVLKKDVKGQVLKCLYFKKPWLVKNCLIKQGIANMIADDFGRDIQRRLVWQLDLHNELSAKIPMPCIFDFFYEKNNAYLVMDFIPGYALSIVIQRIYKSSNWADLSIESKFQLIDWILQITTVIAKLHSLGFIHRDITPDNFLVTKNGKLILIDMELTWSFLKNEPSPPFQLGSPGYMSPEQQRTETPTIQQDIYALGGLAALAFTGLSPLQLPTASPAQLQASLNFFIGSAEISGLICACLATDPGKRPAVETFQSAVANFMAGLKEKSALSSFRAVTKPVSEAVHKIIQQGLNGLGHSALLSPKSRWLSKKQREENQIGNDQFEMSLYNGWHTGMAGPLWLIAIAKISGFDVTDCQTAYSQSWNYIQNNYFKNSSADNPGLYQGGAGIALSIAAGLESSLLANDHVTNENLEACFAGTAASPWLSRGIAGQGLALLTVTNWLDKNKAKTLLDSYLKLIITHQQPDGSWNVMTPDTNRRDLSLEIDDGTAGIIWFLLAVLQQSSDPKLLDAIRLALHWLTKRLRRMNQHRPDLALLYTKAFEIFQDGIYMNKAESLLTAIAARPIMTNLSLNNGAAAMGEIYLEAAQTFDNHIWQERADWITHLLMHSFQHWKDTQGYWCVTGNTNMITADLFHGTTGILHYLIRYLYPEQLAHPLSPSTSLVRKAFSNHL